MSDGLERRLHENLPGMATGWLTMRKVREIVTGTGLAVFKSDADAFAASHHMKNAAFLAAQQMEHATGLVDTGRALSGDDPAKQAVCAQIVQGYVRNSQRAKNLLGW